LSTDVVEAVIGVHGGVKFYNGAARAARAYVECNRSRADDYYLAEGDGVAERLVATPDEVFDPGGLDRPGRGGGLGDLPARGEAVGVERRRRPRQGRGPARPDQPGRRALGAASSSPRT
jgi:hypothetical protein